MIGSVWGLLLVGLVLASSVIALLWYVHVRIRRPGGLLFLLFRVTEIPATESQALRSRADYAEYQRTTSAFVPRPPRGIASPAPE